MTNEKNTDRKCLAISVDAVAQLLSISPRHVWGLNSLGRLPRPIHLGRSARWVRAELEAWLAVGGPRREEWEKLKAENHSAVRKPSAETRKQ